MRVKYEWVMAEELMGDGDWVGKEEVGSAVRSKSYLNAPGTVFICQETKGWTRRPVKILNAHGFMMVLEQFSQLKPFGNVAR